MIKIEIVETSSLGDRSYLAHDGEVAVVVDPQRDIDRVLALASECGVRITHVLETHVHNDYVTGGLERLANRSCESPADGLGRPGMIAGAGLGLVIGVLLDPQVVLLGFAALMLAAGIRMLGEQVPVGGDCALPGGGGQLARLPAQGHRLWARRRVPHRPIRRRRRLPDHPRTRPAARPADDHGGRHLIADHRRQLAAHAGDTILDYRLTAVFTLAAIGGALAAAPLATRVPANRLHRWFASPSPPS